MQFTGLRIDAPIAIFLRLVAALSGWLGRRNGSDRTYGASSTPDRGAGTTWPGRQLVDSMPVNHHCGATPGSGEEGPHLPDRWFGSGLRTPCLLMFSGGRDSTLAAVRLHRAGTSIALVTVTSGHLVGIDRVKRRLGELAVMLPPDTPWIQVRQPVDLRTDTSFYEQTCLPCHHAYVVVSAAMAVSASARCLAFGYARYQADWPEQTPLAVSSLRRVLARYGIRLELPVHDLPSREAALAELASLGMSGEALEQKCLRQLTNVPLSDERLGQQVELWEQAIDRSIAALPGIRIEVLDRASLGAFA